ncbi:glucose-6-phosphate dehydrogenase [Synoicihabitans lomoniglobus]|uniref:Glucose-6-phosphate 1-dehydrogenase n=1 Tax=Synoicihabitans lomoniglobus TaxID=2909285 RepID=A0AAF0I7E6_9BACT|nr:glucose-6-phosphate dehydrogenase [Opitutaceae bacterium LMO-M01]WED66691.1 glucose-6-phosphate dehydrogenase [Opitutaceae bacterium LMO-M01]
MAETSRHPFLQGLSKHRGAPPTAVVIFGASGDLTARKLIPAVYNLAADNLLPPDFHLIGYGRKEISHEAFRELAADAIKEFSRRELSNDVWDRIAARTTYVAGGYDDPAAFDRLAEHLAEIEKKVGRDVQPLFYISTPPSVFGPILTNLGSSGLAKKHIDHPHHAKVIIEKPFGRDLESALKLNQTVRNVLEEHQVYRIDHYLGKETVQDLLVQRFANSIFEPLWNRNFIDNVQITVAEEVGVGTRGGYYEQSGALRDMIQNHTMQLVALTAMEPPVSLDAEAIRDEKVKLLRAIQPLDLGANGDVSRAQYAAGMIGGKPEPGYLDEEGIAPESATETYAAIRLSINNWRWQGVPFVIRSGKRMARRVTEIAVQFKRPPGTLFAKGGFDLAANTLSFQIQPDEGLSLILNGKVPGLETRMQPVKMNFRYSTTYGSNTPEAYERLVLDAMIGDGTLFIRGDEAETSWKLYTPVLEAWAAAGREGMDSYPVGSWGPASADALLAAHNNVWRKP